MRGLAAAAFLLGAAAVATAQPEAHRLDNGLVAAWETLGAYDSVCIAFPCPRPPSERMVGASSVLTAALRAAAQHPGGAAERISRVGGSWSVAEAGGRIEVQAAGLPGSAGELIAALAELLLGGPSTRSLVQDGSLRRQLDGLNGRTAIQGEAMRQLLGRPWWPDADEIRATARLLEPPDLDRLREEWLCASRCGVSVVSSSADVVPKEALAPLAAMPYGNPAMGLPRVFEPGDDSGTKRREDRGQSLVILAAAGPDPFSAAAVPWHVTAQYLGAGNASPLFKGLRAKAGLSYLVGSRWLWLEGGLLWTEAHCDPGDEARTTELLARVVAEAAGEPDGQRVEQSRRWAQTEWRRDMTSPEKRARLRAAGMAMGAGIEWPEAVAEAITKVDSQDIRLVLETLCSDGVWFQIESGLGVGRS
ncbi:MAG: insulinase family protein [Armatimonadota bacterium]|jgi:hypothetical protein